MEDFESCCHVERHTVHGAAEQLYHQSLSGSSSSYCCRPPNDYLNSGISEVLPPTDVVTGMRPGGRMSVVRRFFCLFVTFDLLFTVLMWLICNMLISGDVFRMMSEQIVHYNIHSSLFDIVMAAAARFVVLLLFYGLLYIDHWCIIALSTAGTCSFLIAKVFLYNWVSANSPVLQVLLIVTSFVISWGEAWFLDFRVIPQEAIAKDLLQGRSGLQNERSPLLNSYIQQIPSHQDDHPESVRNFYSPVDSPAGSDDETADSRKSSTTSAKPPSTKAELLAIAHEALVTARKTISIDGWRKEKEEANGDRVESRERLDGKKGRLYRLEGEVHMNPDGIRKLLFNQIENMPVWNPTLTLARRLEVIDEQTDISYQVMAEGGGGLFAPRDFVTLRRWECEGSTIIIVSVSVTHPAAPPKKKPIRAYQGPSCFVLEPGRFPDSTRLQWLVDTELRGWIPQTLLDQSYASALSRWLFHLRSHTEAMGSTSQHLEL